MEKQQTKVTGSMLRNIAITTLIAVVIGFFLEAGYIYLLREFIWNERPTLVERIERDSFLTEYGINQKAKELITTGKEEDLYLFYDKYTKNREISYALISSSLMYNIPINYTVGLCWTESRFCPTAVNVNIDKSVDIGLMQLNSGTFKLNSKEELLDIMTNLRLSAEFIKVKYQKYENWYETILSYNAGSTETVKSGTINHMVFVLEYAKKLDIEFSSIF